MMQDLFLPQVCVYVGLFSAGIPTDVEARKWFRVKGLHRWRVFFIKSRLTCLLLLITYNDD